MSSLPPEQKIILQLKIHSKDSERRIKKWMLGIQGVRRVDFDAERGVTIVSGTIDPPKLLMMLENYGVKAEIFGPHRRPVSITTSPSLDPEISALLKRLPKNSAGLKTVEVTKTVRFYFRDGENGVDHGGGLCGGNGNFYCVHSGGYFPTSGTQPGNLGFSSLGDPPWVAAGVPSAPPLPEGDNSPLPPPPPPPGTNPFYTVFSDDNTSSSCTIM
nr:heavy metal-associated isoprenylated plant protein 6-like [Ipomoea batatas]